MRVSVVNVGWPKQRDEHVYVDKKHAQSSSARLTSSEVTVGESGGKAKTMSPFTVRVPSSLCNPWRIKSETACPRLMERLPA